MKATSSIALLLASAQAQSNIINFGIYTDPQCTQQLKPGHYPSVDTSQSCYIQSYIDPNGMPFTNANTKFHCGENYVTWEQHAGSASCTGGKIIQNILTEECMPVQTHFGLTYQKLVNYDIPCEAKYENLFEVTNGHEDSNFIQQIPQSPCADQSRPVCLDGSKPNRGNGGPPSCSDGSSPLCSDGSPISLNHHGGQMGTGKGQQSMSQNMFNQQQMSQSPCPDQSRPVCLDGSKPNRGNGGPPSCSDGSSPLCSDGSPISLNHHGGQMGSGNGHQDLLSMLQGMLQGNGHMESDSGMQNMFNMMQNGQMGSGRGQQNMFNMMQGGSQGGNIWQMNSGKGQNMSNMMQNGFQGASQMGLGKGQQNMFQGMFGGNRQKGMNGGGGRGGMRGAGMGGMRG